MGATVALTARAVQVRGESGIVGLNHASLSPTHPGRSHCHHILASPSCRLPAPPAVACASITYSSLMQHVSTHLRGRLLPYRSRPRPPTSKCVHVLPEVREAAARVLLGHAA
jgi:hypothetical protein